jgi:hypothetical protein
VIFRKPPNVYQIGTIRKKKLYRPLQQARRFAERGGASRGIPSHPIGQLDEVLDGVNRVVLGLNDFFHGGGVSPASVG